MFGVKGVRILTIVFSSFFFFPQPLFFFIFLLPFVDVKIMFDVKKNDVETFLLTSNCFTSKHFLRPPKACAQTQSGLYQLGPAVR